MSGRRSIHNQFEFECFVNNIPILSDPLDSTVDPLKMSEISRIKCKEVIQTLENGIKDGGEKFAPVLVHEMRKRPGTSTGVQILNFRNVKQHLDTHIHKEITDFVKDVQMALKDVTDNSVIASEVIDEVDAIYDLFLVIMERTFEKLNFSALKGPLCEQF